MKEAIIVDLSGRYIEPTIVPDTQTGVTPVYAAPEQQAGHVPPESQVTSYILAEKVPEGLYQPRWDFALYDRYQALLTETRLAYVQAYTNWSREDVETRGNAPTLILPDAPSFWIEGLTQAEIEATQNQSQIPTLEQEIEQLKSQLAISLKAATDAKDTQQQLLDLLIKKGVL